MDITAQYLNAGHTAVSRSDMPGASIPAVEGNRHWDELVALGVTPADYVATPSPPAPISKLTIVRRMTLAERDAVAALRTGGADEERTLIAEFDAAVEIDPTDAATVAGFETVFGSSRAAELLEPED